METMQASKYQIIILLILFSTSCIEPFSPVIEDSQEVLVINGVITDKPGMHYVDISRSTPYDDPSYKPIGECVVIVIDDNGEIIQFLEEEPGKYSADIPSSFLAVGKAYSLQVITPENEEYQSEYDTILPCPSIDSVYYEIQYKATADPDRQLPGIQLFLDMSGALSDSRNVVWKVEETWEYWASLFGTHILWGPGDGEEFRSNPLFKCWKSFPLDRIYTGTTRNLSANKMQRVALNFVSNETDRLKRTYSLHVKQEALTLEAYTYWQSLNDQITESGGLYEKQPFTVPGNIYNVNDPEELVLGFFYASQVKEQRIYIHNDNLFSFYIPHISCEYESTSTLWGKEDIEYPVYIYAPGPFQPTYTGPSECFDCRLQGGTNIKPDFWDP